MTDSTSRTSMLSITMEYFALLILATHGKCLTV